MHIIALQFSFFPLIFLFYCEYSGGEITIWWKKSDKNSQNITAMGIILEFVGNFRNSFQGLITGLMRSLEYISIHLLQAVVYIA